MTIGEAADIGFAFGDLLTELDVDTTSEQEVQDAVKRLEDLNSQVSQLKDARSEASMVLDPELNRQRSFADNIRRVRQMIAMSKKIAPLLGLKPKGASSALQLQQTQLNYMMLDELSGMRRLQFESLLKERETAIRYRLALAQVKDEEELAARRGRRQ